MRYENDEAAAPAVHEDTGSTDDRGSHRRQRTNDPQMTVMAELKETANTEILVFSVPLGLFEIVCLVNLPEEGAEPGSRVPVYCKMKVNRKLRRSVLALYESLAMDEVT